MSLWKMHRDLRAPVGEDGTVRSFSRTAKAKRDPFIERRCIGCGRFLRADAHWNQCGNCDTREAEDVVYGGSGIYGG